MGNPSSFVEAASVKDVNTFEQAQTFSSGITVTGGISGGVRQMLHFGQPNVALGDNATPGWGIKRKHVDAAREILGRTLNPDTNDLANQPRC